MRISGRQLDDVMHLLYLKAMEVLESYEPKAWLIDIRTERDFLSHPAFNIERRTYAGLLVEVRQVRLPTPMLAPIDRGTVPYDLPTEYPQLLSIESRHRLSDRPRFFDWEGNPEGYR